MTMLLFVSNRLGEMFGAGDIGGGCWGNDGGGDVWGVLGCVQGVLEGCWRWGMGKLNGLESPKL